MSESATKATEDNSKFSKDAEGNVVKKDGWFSVNFRRGKRTRLKEEPMLTVDGRSITVKIAQYEYPDALIIDDAFGDYDKLGGSWKANWGIETRGAENSSPYCINLILHMVRAPAQNDNSFHNHGIATRYCDADGDGIFETRPGDNFRTPAWVK